MESKVMSNKTNVKSLAKKLWSIGLKARVEAEGFDERTKWENLSEAQHLAWEAVAAHVIEHGYLRWGK